MVFRDMAADGTVRITGALPQGGAQGDQGPPGPPGPRFEAVYSFNVASTIWVCVHNQGPAAVIVETYNTDDEQMFGDVKVLDEDTIQISWYFPMTGTARVHT